MSSILFLYFTEIVLMIDKFERPLCCMLKKVFPHLKEQHSSWDWHNYILQNNQSFVLFVIKYTFRSILNLEMSGIVNSLL